MKDVGILNGDLIVVCKIQDVSEGKIIVVWVDNEVIVKWLKLVGDQVVLMLENISYELIMVVLDELVVEGVFVGVI